jgi:hypothetical protein
MVWSFFGAWLLEVGPSTLSVARQQKSLYKARVAENDLINGSKIFSAGRNPDGQFIGLGNNAPLCGDA